MATYDELYSLRNDSALKNRVTSAVTVAAEAVRNEPDTTPNHANRLAWARKVFGGSGSEADRMFVAVLAANSELAVEQIQGASDAQIQANVDDCIDLFADGS